jgi:hypothetical protein
MPTITTEDTSVDLAAPTPVLFDVNLGFSAGVDIETCGFGDELPTGEVHATFTTLPSSLEKDYLDCELGVAPCQAADLYDIAGGVISGSLNVANDATDGLHTATLQVVWTPQD